MEDQLQLPSLRLIVLPETLPLFTTILQSGIEVKAAHGETLAEFLDNFPGFTAEYLANTVQTIFLNGTAVDDLSLPLTGKKPVLALSAAMPGLAGAIFRKNSFHSALRTKTKALQSSSTKEQTVSVTLKLFNSIARDRGQELLSSGICLRADRLRAFLSKRPHLKQSINHIELSKKETEYSALQNSLQQFSKVNLNIVTTDG